MQAIDRVNVVEVEDERPLTAASARTVRDRDLRLRPMQRPSDLFRVTPGLMVVQHAGGGKANQYLLRGFDADHGTDVALSFDGLPLNMVSHGHGQGYADANWIIPELVERVEVSKGPYFVENGDFATAGADRPGQPRAAASRSCRPAADRSTPLRGRGHRRAHAGRRPGSRCWPPSWCTPTGPSSTPRTSRSTTCTAS